MKLDTIHTIAAIIIGIFLAGCSSKSEFYQLKSDLKQTTQISKKSVHSRIVGIAEVETSEYLQKPEIVTRYSDKHLNVHEVERWAGSLEKNIQSVLRQNLEKLIPRYTFLSYPWEEPLSDAYRIYLHVDRYDGDSNGTVTMKGRWSLVRQSDNRAVVLENFNYTGRGGGKDTESIVDTQSKLLEKLSRHIATQIERRIK